MAINKSIFTYTSFLYIILLLGIFSFYLFNPFSNECIKGNCKNGNGVYLFKSGMKYDGEWKNEKRDGQGTLTYSDGSKYTGGWKNDRMHGQGIKIYTSDSLYRKYMGDWKNGNKNGKGTTIYSGGSYYEGDWKDGKIHGNGTMTSIDGRKITGQWKNGVLFRTATEIYPDGKIIIVGRKNERRHGPGTLTYPDGTTITGEWVNNKLVGSLEFYLFIGIEFEINYNITKLCSSIKADISPSLKAHENSIAWLNELLIIPNLYEKFNKKIHGKSFSKDIDVLAEGTKDFRNKKFSELNNDIQKDIVKLNRLLLEHFYPHKTPQAE